MKTYYLIVSLIFISNISWTQLYPIIEADYTFCYFCSNDYVVDKVWRFRDEIYTKIKTENFEYKLYRLSDTVFQVRKFKENLLLEDGKLLLRKENIIKSDTISCYHCVPGDDINEYVFIINHVRPIKYKKWTLYDHNLGASGYYDKLGNKIKTWKYEHKDSIVFYNHDSKETYYYKPNFKIVNDNLNLLIDKFYVQCHYYGVKHGLLSYIHELNSRFSIKLEHKKPQESTKSFLEFDFFEDNTLSIKMINENVLKFEEFLTWEINKNGEIEIKHASIKDQNYILWTMGKEKMSLRNTEKI